MPVIKKIISIAIVTLMAVTTISGPVVLRSVSMRESGSANSRQEPDTAESSDIITSCDIDCYLLGKSLCSSKGEPVNGYKLDEKQNITDLSGKVIVSAENTELFTCAEEIRYNENDLRQTLQTVPDASGKEAIRPTSVSMKLMVQPESAVNRDLTLTSRNSAILYFPESTAESDSDTASSAARPSTSVIAEPDDNGILEVSFIAVGKGHAAVEVRNVLGEELETLEFVFLGEDNPVGKQTASGLNVNGESKTVSSASEDPYRKAASDGHEHVYKTQTMNPTIRTKGYTLHVCTICGYTYRDNYTDLDLCQHKWRVVKTVPATGDSAGYTLYECTVCGQQERRDPQGQTSWDAPKACSHLICSAKVIPATCREGGYTLHECLICHDYSYMDNETPALGHSWDEGTITKEATCLETGIRTLTCQSCGKTKDDSVQATGHSWDEGIVTVTPAEGSKGVKTYTCKSCGAVRTEELPTLIHDWDDGTVTIEPTCTSAGVKTFTCRITGDTRTEELDKLPHTMADEIIPPTDTEHGYTRHYCSVCGFEEERTDFTDPEPHEHDYQLSETEPTCTEPGKAVYICADCGDEKDLTVLDALGHAYEITAVEPTEEEEGYIELHCSRCGYSVKGFSIRSVTPYSSSEGVFDLSAAAEAGNKWLRENGLAVSDEAEDLLESVVLSASTEQAVANGAMEKLCFDAVYKTLCRCREDPSLIPFFHCICLMNEDGNSVELRCCVSFEQ